MKLAEYVLQYREHYNISQRDFAKRCGCSYQYISKLERGEITDPSKKMLTKIATGMGMDINTLFALIDDYGTVPGTNRVSGLSETIRRIAEKMREFTADELSIIENMVDTIVKLKKG